MSYDPEKFSVGWRDIGAGYLLGAAALVGLSLFSLTTGTADEDALSSAITVQRMAAPEAADRYGEHDEEWLDSIRHAEWHTEPMPMWRPAPAQACAPDCIAMKSSRSPS